MDSEARLENNETTLKAAGFFYIDERMIWASHGQRKAFSHDSISDHDSNWLNRCLADRVPTTECWFYFRFISEDTIQGCQSILTEIGLPTSQPVVREGIIRTPT